MQPFYVIYSGHNGEYLSTFNIVGTGPRWTAGQYLRTWDTQADAEAALEEMHPDYRERLQAEVAAAQWVYCNKRQAEVLAIAGI